MYLIQNGDLGGPKLLVQLFNLVRRSSDQRGASISDTLAASRAVLAASFAVDFNPEEERRILTYTALYN